MGFHHIRVFCFILMCLVAIMPKQAKASECIPVDITVAFCVQGKCSEGFVKTTEKRLLPCKKDIDLKFVDAKDYHLSEVKKALDKAGIKETGFYVFYGLIKDDTQKNISKLNVETLDEAKLYFEKQAILYLLLDWLQFLSKICVAIILFDLMKNWKRRSSKIKVAEFLCCAIFLYSVIIIIPIVTIYNAAFIIVIYECVTVIFPALFCVFVLDYFFQKFNSAESKKNLCYQYLLNTVLLALLILGLLLLHGVWWWLNEGG